MHPAVARLKPKSLRDFDIFYPSLEERVAAFSPQLGRKPKFLESFPQHASSLIVKTVQDIIREYSPYAAADREAVVNLVPGVSIPEIIRELIKRLPWITKNRSYPSGPSDDVIAHLLSAPHNGRNASDQYREVILTKLAGGRNDKEDILPLVLPPFVLPGCEGFLSLSLFRPILSTPTKRSLESNLVGGGAPWRDVIFGSKIKRRCKGMSSLHILA